MTSSQKQPGRTFWVKANLDQLHELSSTLWSDSDRAAAFQGLCCGCTGVECPSGVPDAYLRAWTIGASWRQEAEEFRRTRKNGGEASARARAEKFGTAQPPRTSTEHMFEGCSNKRRTSLTDVLMPVPGEEPKEEIRTLPTTGPAVAQASRRRSA
jgi:hypothetical protein